MVCKIEKNPLLEPKSTTLLEKLEEGLIFPSFLNTIHKPVPQIVEEKIGTNSCRHIVFV